MKITAVEFSTAVFLSSVYHCRARAYPRRSALTIALLQSGRPASEHTVIARSRQATWQSPAVLCEFESRTRRLPRLRLAMTYLILYCPSDLTGRLTNLVGGGQPAPYDQVCELFHKNKKRRPPEGTPPLLPLWITLPAQPCWNGGIWYKRTHGTEYR